MLTNLLEKFSIFTQHKQNSLLLYDKFSDQMTEILLYNPRSTALCIPNYAINTKVFTSVLTFVHTLGSTTFVALKLCIVKNN